MRLTVLAIIAAAAMLAPPAAAQPVVADFFSSIRSVRVNGDRAYAVSAAGLSIYDVTDRANPLQLSQLFLDRSGSFKLEISGDYAYVLSGEIVLEKSYLHVVDVSDPLAPHVVATYSDLVEARVQAILITGTTLAVANANAVDLLDISDPSLPRKVASLPIISEPEQIVSLAVLDSTLFAAWIGLGGEALVGGVTSIDIANPASPIPIGIFPLEGTPNSITAAAGTLYVGETLTALVVLDASDPGELVEVGRIDYPLTGQVDVFAKGDRLFTGAPTQDGLRVNVDVFDIRDPRSPQLFGEIEVACQVVGMDFDVVRSDVFMPCGDASGTGLSIFALTPSGDLAQTSSVLVPSVTDVAVSSGTTFLAASDAIYAVRPGAGGRVEILGTLSLAQRALRIEVVGTRAYVYTADNTIGTNGRVQIVDIADPALMRLFGSVLLDDLGLVYSSKRFDVDGEIVYVATRDGVALYDASDPSQPRRLGSFPTPSVAENVLVHDGLAYVNTIRLKGNITRIDLYVVDVRDPVAPRLRGKLRNVDKADFCSDLAIRDGRLYMLVAGPGGGIGVVGDGRLLVLNVRKPVAPRLKWKTSTNPTGSGYARDIVLAGDLAYVAEGLDGVSVLSVGNGARPEFLRAIDTPGFASGVWVGDSGNVSVADLSSFQVYAPPPVDRLIDGDTGERTVRPLGTSRSGGR